jgi:tRNA A-37 threonylcarbamoyl transferase component Bud32/Leucine-rich repeat (LRR) protein/tetratricopeptide (TPR) repeat protein
VATKTPSTQATEDSIERTIRTATVAETVPSLGGSGAVGAAPGTGYRIARLLGRGGEGEVYEAVQQAFGRQVAVKLMRAGAPNPRQVQRFRAEAAVTALLEHPAIIPVHDLCLDDAGRPQLVMKRVSGKTWRALLDGSPGPQKRPLTGEEHVEVLLKVCDAVAFAHSRGILHRDLKPENVMVGEHGEVLVMDWGCAVHVGPKPPHPDIPVLSELSGVSGTPAYLSPEQARADHAACGPWSDVYLLGAVLFRMLTGSPPHRGDDIGSTIALAARGEPPQDPLASGNKIPPELARIAVDAMQPSPNRRTRSAEDFAIGIRRYLEHREVHRLLNEAARQHTLAKAGGPESDDAFRRAISAVEQAVSLWPEHVEARRMVIEVGLDSARHAIAAGAFRIARRQAQAVAAEAERLGDGSAVDGAHKLAGIADMRERQTRSREAKLRATRKLATGGAIVAGLALLVGLLAVWRESANTSRALAEAKANLERADSERAARVEGERLAAPALLAQARELATARKLEQALPLVLAAQGFAPEDHATWLMAGQLLAALGKRDDALHALDRALELRRDALCSELRQLCAAPPVDADLRIADVLVRMGAGGIAASLNLAAEQRADLTSKQLATVWPKLPARCIRTLPDGTLALSLRRSDVIVDNLEPLRGLPISSLELLGQDRIRDLAPLASLPLTRLVASGLPATDFAPILGRHLKELALTGTTFSNLAALRGMPLESLTMSIPGTASLAPLAGMPLRLLHLTECDALQDITALNLKALEELSLDAPEQGAAALDDLGPLRGRPLRELSLSGQRGISDLTSLKGAPLVKLDISGTAIANLRPVLRPTLKNLAIRDCAIDDLRELTGTRLETLELSPQLIRHGLPELKRLTTLRSVNTLTTTDFLRWVDVQRAIVAANPAYRWNAAVVFDGGNPIELRFVGGLQTLSPLRGLPLRVLVVSSGTCSDLEPLCGMPLVTLDVSYTQVTSVQELASIPTLRNLYLAKLRITDLRPLGKLQLESLAFNPSAVQQGMELLRSMPSLQEAGVLPARLLPIRQFWPGYDRGDIK